jgi:Zn-dependent protease
VLEVRATNKGGIVGLSNRTTIKADVWVPPTENAVASSALTVGTVSLVSVAASAVSNPSSFPSSWLAGKINDLLPEGFKEWLKSFIASKHQIIIEQKVGPIFMLTKQEVLSYAVSISVLTFAFSYAQATSLDQILLFIPTVLATSIAVEFSKNLLMEITARSKGIWAEHRLWYLGLATFLISTLVFKTPFSSPSRLVHHSPKFTRRSLGLVAFASVIIALAFASLFCALFVIGIPYVGSIGLAMCLLMAFFDSIPVSPMNGKDIYDWHKGLWAALFLVVLSLYVLWLLFL